MTRILYVDDEPLMAADILWLLERQGYEVEGAMNVSEALQKLDSRPYDIVITDLMMPLGDTTEVDTREAFRLRKGGGVVVERARSKGIRTMVVSAAMDREMEADIVMCKTCHFDDILEGVKRLVNWPSAGVKAAVNPENVPARIGPFLDRVPEEVRWVVECVLHDLRGSLALSACDTAELCDAVGTLAPGDAEQLLKRLPGLSKEALYYTRLLYDILVGSDIQFKNVDACTGVREGTAIAKRFMAEGTELSYVLGQDSISVRGDLSLLTHVVMNLVRNAFEAAGVGGNVYVECRVRGNDMRLIVANTGPQIKDLDRVFEWGWSTKDASHKGVGLAFCARAMDAMGGTIRYVRRWKTAKRVFENAFVLTLPIQKEDAQ